MKKEDLYFQEIKSIINIGLNWEKVRGKTFLISGASGSIGRVVVDVLMELNESYGLECSVIALSRNKKKAEQVFKEYWDSEFFTYISWDITKAISIDCTIDYVFHMASNTHPVQYAKEPIETITANTIGTFNLLQLACDKEASFMLMSSVEIYGENNSEHLKFSEDDMGYLNCATLRAGYPESKRVAESLCYAFAAQKKVKFQIVRLARVYGITMQDEDSKAVSQFFRNAVRGEDIVLKSEGKQFYSYVYVIDAVAGIFAVLLNGKANEVYNISGTNSVITLYELAQMIAEEFGVSVIRMLPDETESKGFSKATRAVLDNKKLTMLGWQEKTSILEGIKKINKAIL